MTRWSSATAAARLADPPICTNADVATSTTTHRVLPDASPDSMVTSIALLPSAERMLCTVESTGGASAAQAVLCDVAASSLRQCGNITFEDNFRPMSIVAVGTADRPETLGFIVAGAVTTSDDVAEGGRLYRLTIRPFRVKEVVQLRFPVFALTISSDGKLLFAAGDSVVTCWRIDNLQSELAVCEVQSQFGAALHVAAASNSEIETGDPSDGAYHVLAGTERGLCALRLTVADLPSTTDDDTLSPARSTRREAANSHPMALKVVARDHGVWGADLVAPFAAELRSTTHSVFAAILDADRNLRLVQVPTAHREGLRDGSGAKAVIHGIATRLHSQPTAAVPAARQMVLTVGSSTLFVPLVLSLHELPDADTCTALMGRVDDTVKQYADRRRLQDSAPSLEDDMSESLGCNVALSMQDGSILVVVPLTQRLSDVLVTVELALAKAELLPAALSNSGAGGSGTFEIPAALALQSECVECRRLWSPIMTSLGIAVVNGDTIARAHALTEPISAHDDEVSDATSASEPAVRARQRAKAAWHALLLDITQDYPLLVSNDGVALQRLCTAFESLS
jgi:hypothetical protein